LPEGYDPGDRTSVEEYLRDRLSRGEIATGILYLNESGVELHKLNQTPVTGLNQIPLDQLCPGAEELSRLQEDFR
jgi:2-oxoglutarate ferredoxin oxidoreductase subunit beta